MTVCHNAPPFLSKTHNKLIKREYIPRFFLIHLQRVPNKFHLQALRYRYQDFLTLIPRWHNDMAVCHNAPPFLSKTHNKLIKNEYIPRFFLTHLQKVPNKFHLQALRYIYQDLLTLIPRWHNDMAVCHNVPPFLSKTKLIKNEYIREFF